MKRLALIVAALAACVMFTACPDNKPTDEPVVIPDGTYEETAHVFVYKPVRDSSVYDSDTIRTTIVDIKDGYFMYRGMCEDTFHREAPFSPGYFIRYHSHFIYEDGIYCNECQEIRFPARAMKNGFILVEQPAFSLLSYPRDTAYRREFRIYREGANYTFEQRHYKNEGYGFSHNYKIQHTLTPLSD